MPKANVFASNLKFLRKKQNLTQKNLAGLLGFKRHCLSSWEEERAFPKIDDFFLLCDYLKVSARDMYEVDLLKQSIANNLRRKSTKEFLGSFAEHNVNDIIPLNIDSKKTNVQPLNPKK